ncbi:MAG: ergothioneine biosynthesis protein EgtB [Wenzhouxiangella sp.]|nr:MAG: ergothioneine biosynthesis protein EgtB [Wenzhouxiangella sp.]
MSDIAPELPGHFNEIDPGLIDSQNALFAYGQVRSATERFSAALSAEDQNLQSMPDTSPVKWHRAHTSWFFETFLLKPFLPGYRGFDDSYTYLFNSYYNGVGAQYPRPSRGLISRPDMAEIGRYRACIDESMAALLQHAESASQRDQIMALVVLGLNHEQQHQELMATDIKHALSYNPACPAIVPEPENDRSGTSLNWIEVAGGLIRIGSDNPAFCFDNERPRHRVFLNNFKLASRPVSCGDFLAFIDDQGYRRPELWLSDGWAWVRQNDIQAPLYWLQEDGEWLLYTLGGKRALDPAETACHLNFYEACAYAQWAGARLPTEAEWEHASTLACADGPNADSGRFHPDVPAAAAAGRLSQMFGGVWEWTQSSYAPYPGFQPAAGAVGEYNGKFMANQMVLRGGSCATPGGHVRPSYRNFFYPPDRWQFTGVRLARDGEQ